MWGTLGCDVNPVVGAVAFPVIFIFWTTLWEPLSLERMRPDHLSLSPVNVLAHGQQLQALGLSPGEGLEHDWGGHINWPCLVAEAMAPLHVARILPPSSSKHGDSPPLDPGSP